MQSLVGGNFGRVGRRFDGLRREPRQSVQDISHNRDDAAIDTDHDAWAVVDESRHYVDRRDDQSRDPDHYAIRCDDEDRGHGHDGNGATGHLYRVDLDCRADQELQRDRDSEVEPAELHDFDQRRVQDNDTDLHRHD